MEEKREEIKDEDKMEDLEVTDEDAEDVTGGATSKFEPTEKA